MDRASLPILLAGAGAMGGALIAGWRRDGALAASDLIISDPHPGEPAKAAGRQGAVLDPSAADIFSARTVVLAVKPQTWRAVGLALAPRLAPDADLVSVVAGVDCAALSAVFGGRPIGRAMPTTAAAIGHGAASVWAGEAGLRGRIAALFEPLGAVIELENETLMHAATAASGSAPAYLYAFIEALEAAAVGAGLPEAAAARLVRATITGAAALLADGDDEPAELRRRVTSPGGTTEAALKILSGDGGLAPLLARAVAAAAVRSRELAT